MDDLVNWFNNLPITTQEKILTALAASSVTLFLTTFLPKIVWPATKRLVSFLIELSYRRLAGYRVFNSWGIRRYERNLLAKLERIVNPWTSQRLQLDDLFVPVKVSESYLLPHLVPGERPSEQVTTLHLAYSEYDCFVLVGEPGAGKSTALKSLGVSALREKSRLPAFIELRSFALADCSLEEFILEKFEENGFPRSAGFLARGLAKGNFLVLLDGLDEVGDAQFSGVIDKIKSFFQNFPENRLIVTCRTAAYERQLDEFSDVTICLRNFNDSQVSTFLRQWTYPPAKSSVNLMQTLRRKPEILAICRNPLMLTIVAALYIETDYELPDSRAEFYLTCIDAVLKRWDRVRDIDRHNRFSSVIKMRFLRDLALSIHSSGSPLRDQSQARIIEFLESLLPRMGLESEIAEEFLTEVVSNSGLLIYTGPRRLRFAHLTFQEFFAALEIESNRTAAFILEKFVEDTTLWREVLLLYCGVSSKNTQVIEALSRRDAVMAAICIADSEMIDVDIASKVIDKLRLDLSHVEHPEQILGALARLAGNEGKVWARWSFDVLRQYLHSAPHETGRQAAVAALANIPIPQAAAELANALQDKGTQTTAKEALIQLGPVSLPAIATLLESEDYELSLLCIEVCASVPAPEVLDILGPLLEHKAERVRVAAAWVLAILLRDPAVESSIAISRFAVTPDGEVYRRDFTDWAWPFAEESPALSYFAQNILGSLRRLDHSYEMAKRFADERPDLRISTPFLFALLQAGHSYDEPKFRELVDFIFMDYSLARHRTEVRPPYAQYLIELLELPPASLMEYWRTFERDGGVVKDDNTIWEEEKGVAGPLGSLSLYNLDSPVEAIILDSTVDARNRKRMSAATVKRIESVSLWLARLFLVISICAIVAFMPSSDFMAPLLLVAILVSYLSIKRHEPNIGMRILDRVGLYPLQCLVGAERAVSEDRDTLPSVAVVAISSLAWWFMLAGLANKIASVGMATVNFLFLIGNIMNMIVYRYRYESQNVYYNPVVNLFVRRELFIRTMRPELPLWEVDGLSPLKGSPLPQSSIKKLFGKVW